MDDFEILFLDDQTSRETVDHRRETKQRKRVSFANDCPNKETESPEFKRELAALRKFERRANRLFLDAQRLPKCNDQDDHVWSERALNYSRYDRNEETKRLKRINNLLDK